MLCNVACYVSGGTWNRIHSLTHSFTQFAFHSVRFSRFVGGRKCRSAVVSGVVSVVVGRIQSPSTAARRRLLRDGLAQAVPEGLEEVQRERRSAEGGHRATGDARRRRESPGGWRHPGELGGVRTARRLHQRTGAKHAVYQLRRGNAALRPPRWQPTTITHTRTHTHTLRRPYSICQTDTWTALGFFGLIIPFTKLFRFRDGLLHDTKMTESSKEYV